MNISLITPQIFLSLWAVFIMLIDFVKKRDSRSGLGYLSILGLGVTAVLVVFTPDGNGFFGTYLSDSYAKLFDIIFLLAAIMTIVASIDFAEIRLRFKGEYYALIMLATVGMMFLAGSGELITLYVSLELATIPLYVLAAFLKRDNRSTEAGLKYLIIGGASSGILLFALSILYGLTGTTVLADMNNWELANQSLRLGLNLGIVLFIAGFGFKLAAAPFHMWAPDVYQGAPTPITAFLSVASKAAGLVALVRIFFGPLIITKTDWTILLEITAVLAMVIGNFVALWQTDIKRMLAYSSIAQVGYVLVALTAVNEYSIIGMMIFLFAYLFANIGAFMVAIGFSNMTGSDRIDDYAGMIKRNPLVSIMMTIFMLSLVGIPPTAGFLGKYWLFAAAVKGQIYWLVVIAVLTSVVSLFYYINVVKKMFFERSDNESILRYGPTLGIGITVSGIMVILILVMQSSFYQWASDAAKVFFQ